jgi:hypothetical protein
MIKNAIKSGENIIGATIKENQNLQIKWTITTKPWLRTICNKAQHKTK